MKDIRKIVYLGLFIALEVILTRFLSIQTPIVRIGFTFLPVAISAIMFGPINAGITAAMADILGMMIFPSGGAYFPGFSLSAFLSGSIYGILLYKKDISLVRVSLAVVLTSVIISLGLDTTWLMIITGKGYLALLPVRIIKSLLMIPIQIPLIIIVWRYAVSQLYRDQSIKVGQTKA